MVLNKGTLYSIAIACCISLCSGACFTRHTCTDGNASYVDGDIWMSETRPCYSCMCMADKVQIKLCILPKENSTNIAAIEAKIKEEKTTKKKSRSPTYTRIQIVVNEDQEPGGIPCPEVTNESINPHDYYIAAYVTYKNKEMHCCRQSFIPRGIHPSCTIRRVGECEVQVVKRKLKGDEDELCEHPHSLVG